MRKRLANSRPARLAFQLEARHTQSTILSNVFRPADQPITRCAQLQAWKLFNWSERSDYGAGSGQTFQETSSTQWQKN
jgi:hypothetical protein